MHKRLTPNNIPLFRVLSYDGGKDAKDNMSALKWLRDVKNLEIHPYGWKTLEMIQRDLLPKQYQMMGQDPNAGVMWGNDMGQEYIWYDNNWDRNIIKTAVGPINTNDRIDDYGNVIDKYNDVPGDYIDLEFFNFDEN
jgi:hypothetical protein